MSAQKIVMVPVHEIRVVNPRSRSRVTFNAVTASIESVGLKKPITVHRRERADDGTCYDLVCGQGRLESIKALGEPAIPAIVSDAPEDERYLMSLVENLARRPPSNRDLLREVRRLGDLKYKPHVIAEKIGMDKSYVYGIQRLIQHGESDLIARVEAGRLPLDIAITIAKGKDGDIQRALSDAYDHGALRGQRLVDVQRLITHRKAAASKGSSGRITGQDLVRAYEHHTQQQRGLIRRAALVTHRLAVLTSSLRRLWADDHFLTLLRAEGLSTVPAHVATRVGRKD